MATGGNLTVLEVSDDDTTYATLGCTFVIPDVDWGTEAVNKEYCINSNTPIITVGNTEFASSTVEYAWTEASETAGNVLVKASKDATTEADKELWLRVTVNNSGGTNGTQYVSKVYCTGYKHIGFTKDGSIKTQAVFEQLSVPVETVAA